MAERGAEDREEAARLLLRPEEAEQLRVALVVGLAQLAGSSAMSR
ncbi:MAG: hypothetical protein U1F25_12250 [Rubrivivax sp.]